MNSLKSISPLDGRYADKTKELRETFSEFELIRCRIYVEIEYFIFFLTKILKIILLPDTKKFLDDICLDFDENECLRIKEIEKETNHDVKAVEYYIKEKLKDKPIEKYKEFVHFGLTSQDINSVSYVIQLKNYTKSSFSTELFKCLGSLSFLINETKRVVMLARTHGQPATPTTMGKELEVFHSKIKNQYNMLLDVRYKTKFGGATGNLNAHRVAFPDVDWEKELEEFLEIFGVGRHRYTTQIDNYEMYAVIFDTIRRIQTIFVDFCQDIWYYISLEYFTLKKKEGEIGSSTMPHKVNPIDFENAEGNFLLSNAILQFLSNKLPISRLQRDLTDSTLLRNLGVAFGYGFIALKSVQKGIEKLQINKEKIHNDLDKNWCVILEGIQTILRREAYPNAYEIVKDFINKNKILNQNVIAGFIDGLDLNSIVKDELKRITPFNYC